MLGIRRFTIFLVDAAKTAPADVRFEREEPRPKKRAAARKAAPRGGAAKAPAARKPSAPKKSASAPKGGKSKTASDV